jgi:hypothetical protein
VKISKLPIRQKSFVLGAATVAAAAGAAGTADAQVTGSVTYSTGTLASASVTANPNVTSGTIISSISAGESATGSALGITNLPLFNPALFNGVGGSLAELTGITISFLGSASFFQSVSWHVGNPGAYSFYMSLSPASVTLQLTQPSFGTLNFAPGGGSCSNATSGATILSSRSGTLNCSYISGGASGTSSLNNGNFGAMNGFGSPTNPFYGSGDVGSLNLALVDASTAHAGSSSVASVSYGIFNYSVNSLNSSATITYNYQYVPAPDALAIFLPGLTGALALARRKKRAARRAA